MKRKFLQLVILAVLALASVGAMAQTPRFLNLSGSVDMAGPWTVRGTWFLHVIGSSSKGTFSAAVNMQRSDYWLLQNGKPDDPTDLGQHTHHITVTDGTVSSITGGFEIKGTATITVNGGPAPISPSGVTIDVTGSDAVPYSNIAITFDSPASKHFGTDPLTGVVTTQQNSSR